MFLVRANRKKLILPLEKYVKTLKDMIIGNTVAKILESFTSFRSGQIMMFYMGI